MANATNIRVADYRDGVVYHDFTALSSEAWTAIAGYGYNSQNWVTAIKFQVAAPASSVTFAWYAWNSEGGFRDLKYKITEGESSSYINATSSTAGDGTFTAESGQYSQTTFTATKSLKANTDYVLYIWTNRSTSYNSFTSIRVWNASTYPLTVTYTAAASYKLTLSVGSNVTASVSITSSPFGRTLTIGNNSTIYSNEVITLTYTVASGYAIATHTLNGTTVNSGATHTVAANVTIVLTAAASLSTISTGNGTFGTAQTITVTRYNSAYTHSIIASVAGQHETIVSKGSSLSYYWTPSTAIMDYITNAMSAPCTLSCTTYNGDTQIGVTQITITLSLPTSGTYSVLPTPGVSVVDPTGYSSTFGGFVQGKSKLKGTVSPGTKYSATVAKLTSEANGSTYTTQQWTTSEIVDGNSVTVDISVTDSRGQTGTYSVTYGVISYTSPALSGFGVHRTDAQGNPDESGSNFVATYTVAVSPVNNINAKNLKVRYKAVSGNSWTEDDITLSSYSESGSSAPQPITPGSSYDVQLVLADSFETITMSTRLSTIPVTMDFNAFGNGVAFGKVSEYQNLFDVEWPVRLRSTVTVDGSLTAGGQSLDLYMVTGTLATSASYSAAISYPTGLTRDNCQILSFEVYHGSMWKFGDGLASAGCRTFAALRSADIRAYNDDTNLYSCSFRITLRKL